MAENNTRSRDYTTDVIKADIDNVSFLGNVHVDNVVTALIALSAELWTNRRRVKVIEKLLADRGITTEMIQQYVPTAEENTAWAKERELLVERIFDQFASNQGGLTVGAPWKDK